MKQVVLGKTYDTETAEEIGSHENEYGNGDFRWIEETLYKRKRGGYFVHGRGGAMSPYVRRCGDGSYCSGQRIVPLTDEEAAAWEDNALNMGDVVIELDYAIKQGKW